MKLEMPTRQTLLRLHGLVRDRYDDAIWAYADASYIVRKFYLKRLSTLLDILPDTNGLRILEIGAGSGILQASLKHSNGTVFGSDIHTYLAGVKQIMREDGEDLDLIRCDARHLPFARESVGLVVGSSILEHLNPAHLSSAFSEFYDILTPEGCLAVGYPIESLPVRLFFKSIGFDFGSDHPSKAKDIRENARARFGKPKRIKRIPSRILPNALSFYETALFRKVSDPKKDVGAERR